MSFRLLIKPPAEKDIDEIYAWYNLERQTLGDDFLKELERSFEFIRLILLSIRSDTKKSEWLKSSVSRSAYTLLYRMKLVLSMQF